jgi:D-alanyl-lipoteichoic acid acyltransferase DltB (MBOAT superfamily)
MEGIVLFNSYQFIFLFLPVTFLVYFYLNHKNLIKESKYFLLLSSLFFYSWWNIAYLPIILASIVFNYGMGSLLNQKNFQKKTILTFAISMNLLLLGYFKYTDFFLENINLAFDAHVELLHLALPLAISFFTFQQIAYLVSSYRGETKGYHFIDYSVFVTFFPQLIAGPIVNHKEMIPQFEDTHHRVVNYRNITMGIFIFSIGLFKKVVIADTFSECATMGFDLADYLNFIEAWMTSLSYTFQLYFDFSGYTDMAIGLALLFNIKLPINFNSPYKALDIQDFWRRWHITLSRFLRDYIYIPLGGSRGGSFNTYRNLMVTFILGGIWHGAGWTFIFWGFLHGLALVIHRLWQGLGVKLPRWFAWFITFNFINLSWVFFRAVEWKDAIKVLSGMAGLSGVALPGFLAGKLAFLSDYGVTFMEWLNRLSGNMAIIGWIVVAFVMVLRCKNSNERLENFEIGYKTALWSSIAFLVSALSLNKVSEFLYFNF